MSWAAFTDFKLILAKGIEGSLVADAEFEPQYNPVEFGYVVNPDGTVSRVAKDDPTSMGTIKGKAHSEHGLTNFEMTVKVEGGVKVGMGTCNWGGDVKINGATAFSTNAAGKCWHQDKVNNIAYGHYVGEAGTITIAGGAYTAYVSVEAETVKSNAVAFSLGAVECEGTLLPEGKDVIGGESMNIPANYTLYKEGYTLTGWTDGKNIYNTGSSFVPTEDVTLTPVFTQNTKSLADRTEPVTIKWNFRRDQGAPVCKWEGKAGLIYVAQATVAGETIDVKMDFSTSPGKFNNGSNNDWCQVNNGTKFTIPSCKGATVSLETYNAISATTIDGVAAEGNTNNTYSTEIAGKAETIDIVVADGSYYRYIQVVLPVAQAAGGAKFDNVAGTITWQEGGHDGDASAASENVKGAVAQAGAGFGEKLKVETATYLEQSMTKLTPSESNYGAKGEVAVEYRVKTKAGVKFTPTKLNFDAVKVGTDGAYTSWSYVCDGKESEVKELPAAQIIRNNATKSDLLHKEFTISAEPCSEFILRYYISNTANNKNQAISNVVISGTFNGTAEDVTQYALNVASNIEGAGTVTKYPNDDMYDEGDEITLTATENFGYDFVNWTNTAGEEVSKETKFKATVTANETYTANFKKVETYELAVILDGGANSYMVSYTPAPTIVNEKMMYEAGTKVAVAASENPVLTFNNWSTGETSKEIVVTMDKDVNITANYSAIDFIVGWDFYQTGGRTRVADFIGNTENEVSTMDMIDASGTSKGFYLRPYNNSYEGKTCALNWNALAEKYYFQTMINAADFSNIKVQSQMMYNYNAYTVQKLEASLDGNTWETITSQDLGGTKNWQEVNGTLPAKYDHQAKVYLRWIPDYTSEVKGTSSANDGTCLANVYVIAEKKLVDDGKAPALVTTVPAEGANNASANGKIVLTFDEKIKVAEGAKASLGTMTLTPVVSGKTVSFEYKSLDYSTAYTFTLPAKSVADLTDNYITEAITINFQTKAKPAVEKGMYDVIVSNGNELKAAIAAANSRKDQNVRFRIFVKKGAHVLPTEGKTTGGDSKEYDDPRTTMTASNVSIIGEDFETTSFTNITPAATWDNGFGPSCPLEGIGKGDVLINKGTSNYFQGITIKTSMGDAHGRDIAFNDQGNKTIFKDARLWGYQDTYVSNSSKSRYYFENGVIRGRTDYICGKGDVWYEQVTFQQVKSGYLAVPSQPTKYGYILNKCTIVSDGTGSNDANGSYTLGRPWGQGTPTALYLNCVFNAVPSSEGWSEMSGGWPARFAEYNSTTANGTVIDLSKRKKTFGDKTECNNPVLSAQEASEYSIAKVMGEGDDWDPTAFTEQASAPKNVIIANTTLTWDNSNYVLCWAICKNGTVVDFTKEPTYTVDDASATWSVRAANEMGGLGEATIAISSTGINETMAEMPTVANAKFVKDNTVVIKKNGAIYNVAGAQMK